MVLACVLAGTANHTGVLVATYGVYYAWFFSGTRRVKSSARLTGKTVLITGANAGIGRETAVDLARRGARVIMACRNQAKAQTALAQVRKRSRSHNVIFKQVDLSDMKSVRTFAEEILREEERLDILINNAGMVEFSERSSPSEGFDITMTTNHVGHFLLTLTLIDLIKKSAPGRIINVSSMGHVKIERIDYTNTQGKGISGFESYCQSKLANIHFTKELARRLEGTGVTAVSLHPGTIYTSIWESGLNNTHDTGGVSRYLWYIALPLLRLLLLSEKDGAQTTIYCAIDDAITQHSGRYFTNCSLGNESGLAKDERLAKQLWDVSCEATGIDPNILQA